MSPAQQSVLKHVEETAFKALSSEVHRVGRPNWRKFCQLFLQAAMLPEDLAFKDAIKQQWHTASDSRLVFAWWGGTYLGCLAGFSAKNIAKD